MAEVLSGQTTVTTAGTEVVLAAAGTVVNCAVAIRGVSANTGYMYVGNDGAGAVSATTGHQLAAGDTVVIAQVRDLSDILVDASVNGEKVSWMVLARW